MKTAVVMMSGGLDSTVLAYWAVEQGWKICPLFIDYGQHCAEIELTNARLLAPKVAMELRTISLRGVYANSQSRLIREADLWIDTVTADDIFLPYRNALLLTAACAYAGSNGIETVFAAFINSNHAREIDATHTYLERTRELAAHIGSVHVEFPFRELSKTDVAKLGLQLGAPIAETYSCQVKSQTHCGACPNCVDRLTALRALRTDGPC